MMRVLIVAVNYNSYGLLYKFLDKAIESRKLCEESLDLKIIVADNSSERDSIDTTRYECVGLEVLQLDNLGYLGGAQQVINSLDNILDFDVVAISNVDLFLDDSFFSSLCRISYPNQVGWIAPSIYSLQEGRDKKTIKRPSKWKLVALRFMYRIPLLYRLYYNTAYKRKKYASYSTEEQDIYAGHGSFIILTRRFFETYRTIEYPVFLFCEEYYLAELIRKAGLTVRYYPSLKIWDSEHVSVRSINYSRLCKLNYQAVDYILKTFYSRNLCK